MKSKDDKCEICTTVWDFVQEGVLKAAKINREEFAAGHDITEAQAINYAHALDSALFGTVGFMLELKWSAADIGIALVRALQSHGVEGVGIHAVKVQPPTDLTKAVKPTGAGMN